MMILQVAERMATSVGAFQPPPRKTSQQRSLLNIIMMIAHRLPHGDRLYASPDDSQQEVSSSSSSKSPKKKNRSFTINPDNLAGSIGEVMPLREKKVAQTTMRRQAYQSVQQNQPETHKQMNERTNLIIVTALLPRLASITSMFSFSGLAINVWKRLSTDPFPVRCRSFLLVLFLLALVSFFNRLGIPRLPVDLFVLLGGIDTVPSDDMEDRKKILKEMKRSFGVGGTMVDGVLEIQGAYAARAMQVLKQKGYHRAKKIGK